MYVSRYIHTRIVIRKRITIHIHPDVCASHHTNITIYILRAPPEALRFAAQRTAAHRGPAHRDSEAGPPFGCGLRRARPERAIEGWEGGGWGGRAGAGQCGPLRGASRELVVLYCAVSFRPLLVDISELSGPWRPSESQNPPASIRGKWAGAGEWRHSRFHEHYLFNTIRYDIA